jgi:tripartite-type tricarboxylate transporter receptor subunit TctC
MKITAFRLALALLAASAAPLALAQDGYPNKPVRFVNNFPAGGPSDLLARSVANVLQETLKQSFVVENKAGAAGNIGAADVAKSPADGYTVLFGIDTTFTVNPHLYGSMPFKRSDFKPVVVMASSGLLVGVNPGTGIKNLAGMVDMAKTKGLNFSSAGSGSPGHLAVEVIKEATQAKITHVPYRGNTPAVTAVLSGEVDGGVLATPGMLPHVQTGKITALAVTSRPEEPGTGSALPRDGARRHARRGGADAAEGYRRGAETARCAGPHEQPRPVLRRPHRCAGQPAARRALQPLWPDREGHRHEGGVSLS